MAEKDDALLKWWSQNIGKKQTHRDDGKISIAKTYLEGADVTPEGKYVPRKTFENTRSILI